MLEIEGLTRRFGPVKAVDGVSLSVPAGQMVGVIGRSGAGKSTLLRLINRLTEPSEGRIIFEGRDVTALKGRALRDWRTGCAMIFQQFNLVQRLDVLTNVLIGRLNHRHGVMARLGSLFCQFSAEERAMALAALERFDLLSTALQRADTLSGGQQQRVAICRALMQQPRIILADEPIASLDPRNARTVMDALAQVNSRDGITV
ncbi:MAG: phosphonate ABC transporter ATP-binding protein, partial [Roseococcus sp.]